MSTILNNPFYMGLIRIRKTGELFQGVHEPLIDNKLFDRVQAVLRGRITHRRGHRFRYQRLLRCRSCGYALIAERQKGNVYYRCHTPRCAMTGVREERIDKALCHAAQAFKVCDADLGEIKTDIEVAIEYLKRDVAAEKQAIALSIAAADARLGRLTDALIDGLLDQTLYLKRKGELLNERAELTTRLSGIDEHGGHWRQRADRILELVKTLGNLPDLGSEDDLRDLLKTTTSNLTAPREDLVVAWQNPFQRLMDADAVSSGAPNRIEPRTDKARIGRILLDYIKDDTPPVERPRERPDRKWRRIDDEEPPVSLAA